MNTSIVEKYVVLVDTYLYADYNFLKQTNILSM